MKQSHMIALLQDAQTVGVQYPGSKKEYTFKCTPEQIDQIKIQLGVGETVYAVVETGAMSVVEVSKIHDEPQIDIDADFEYRWIVDIIDTSRYQDLQEMDKAAAKTLRNARVKKKQQELVESLGVDKDSIPTVRRLGATVESED